MTTLVLSFALSFILSVSSQANALAGDGLSTATSSSHLSRNLASNNQSNNLSSHPSHHLTNHLRWKKTSPDTISLGLTNSTNFLELNVISPDDKTEYKFTSNAERRTGIVLGLLRSELMFTTSKSSDREDLEPSDVTDIKYKSYFEKHAINVSYQDHKGLYLEKGPTHLESAGGLDARSIALSYHYIFRPNRYSYSAAYSNFDVQKASGGSYFLFSSLRKDSVTNRSSTLKNKIDLDSLGDVGSLSSFKAHSLSLGGGYGYTAVLKERWFANLSIGIGYGYSHFKFNSESESDASTTSIVSFSAGYNSDLFRLALYGESNGFYYALKDSSELRTGGTSTGFQLIYRWNDSPIGRGISRLTQR